jgi:hypothetical protein
MNRPSYRVGFAGVDDSDRKAFRTMLDSASAQLQADWHVAEGERADLVVCGLGHRVSAAGGRIVARLVDDAAPGTAEDPRVLPLPVRLMPVIELFRYAETLLASRARASTSGGPPRNEPAPPAATAASAAASAAVRATSGNPWIDLALAIRGGSSGVLKAELRGRGPIWIDLAARRYAMVPTLTELRAPNAALEFDGSPPDGGTRPAELERSRKLEELLWVLGLRLGNGEFARWLDPATRFRLQNWPNFAVLPHTLAQMRIASHLGNFQSSAVEVAAALKINQSLVNDVVNALSLMGLLRAEGDGGAARPSARGASPAADPERAPAPTSSRIGGLLGQLRRKFGL